MIPIDTLKKFEKKVAILQYMQEKLYEVNFLLNVVNQYENPELYDGSTCTLSEMFKELVQETPDHFDRLKANLEDASRVCNLQWMAMYETWPPDVLWDDEYNNKNKDKDRNEPYGDKEILELLQRWKKIRYNENSYDPKLVHEIMSGKDSPDSLDKN